MPKYFKIGHHPLLKNLYPLTFHDHPTDPFNLTAILRDSPVSPEKSKESAWKRA
jgi:hypothetical protein